jgi:hypothetical protein
MWQLNIATLIRFFTAVLLAPCGATAKHGNYYSGKFMFFKLEKKYLLAGVILCIAPETDQATRTLEKREPPFSSRTPSAIRPFYHNTMADAIIFLCFSHKRAASSLRCATSCIIPPGEPQRASEQVQTDAAVLSNAKNRKDNHKIY